MLDYMAAYNLLTHYNCNALVITSCYVLCDNWKPTSYRVRHLVKTFFARVGQSSVIHDEWMHIEWGFYRAFWTECALHR